MVSNSDSNSARPLARVYLVRHGETQANRDGIVQGQQDTTLNALGREQARNLGLAFQDMVIGRLISSDLQRAFTTAEAILEHHPGVELEKRRGLRERFLGNLEGKRGGGVPDKSAETSAAFSQRAMEWWNKDILARIPDSNEEAISMVVTTHGGFISALVRDLLGSRKAVCGEGVGLGPCFNASISVIEVMADKKGVIKEYGTIAHLSSGAGGDFAPLGSNADVTAST